MKKKNLGKWLVVLVALVAVSTSMIAETFAKYTSEFAGSDTALVAKWDVKFTDGTDEYSDLNPIDIFGHNYTGNIVANAGTDKIIAPGVKGSFVLKVDYNLDVTADFEFDIVKTGPDLPLTFTVNGGSAVGLSGLEGAIDTAFGTTLPIGSGNKTVTVNWEWPFERGANPAEIATNDAADTGFGQASVVADRTTYKLDVTLRATQKAPTN